ncbi:M56 family metallopeptidase [Prescottella agglutinans]|uniref:Zn-dependent protease with chaperone function n=1 Tax=Prescottella agglutinans TaxID=1644129 RepID=A0ABT6MAT7_9NOCA|nr:M56 family metallopeptidase [Prescottella agglutinans]MDH6281416.1 Zn-dependent protease with chaperone function [Prescottella agglutinans]
MSAALYLLTYTAVVAVTAPRVLIRLTRRGNAPRLGVVAWSVAIGSLVASAVGATTVAAVDLARSPSPAGTTLVHACEHLARILVGEQSDPTARYAAVALVIAAVVAIALNGFRLAWNLSASRRSTHGHARTARLVGRPIAGHDAVVLDAPQRAAYCIAGRPNAIVVTSAALDALDDGQLGAVLAHERAHLTGRHPQVLAVVRALADSVPRSTLFTTGATEIARLLEMCADDRAVRTHSPHTLLRGLIALTGPAPSGALGAGNVAVLDRAGRLASPPRALDRARNRALLTATIATVAGLPLAAGALMLAGRMLCITALM